MKRTLITIVALTSMSLSFGQNTLTLQPAGVEGKDARLSSRYPNVNAGDSDGMDVLAWTNGGVSDTYRELIAFDLSSIPTGSDVNSAVLYLFHDPLSSNTNAQSQSLSGPNTLVIQKVTSMWNEQTVTWNTQPTTTPVGQLVIPQSSSPTQDYVIDVTSLIQDAVDNQGTNFGFLLKLQVEEYYRSVILASSDNPIASNHPKLVVEYRVAGLEVNSKSPIQCYPNPANSGSIVVKSDEIGLIEVVNSLGENVLSPIKLIGGMVTLDVSTLRSGAYFLKVLTDSGQYQERVVIL